MIETLNTRSALRGTAFALALLLPSILVIVYGLAGSSGNSTATGAAILASIAFLAATSWHRPPTIDIAFAVLVACAVASSLTAPAASRNETIALALTLAGFVAGRGLSIEDLPGLRSACIITAGVITAIGAVFTAYTLLTQWDAPHGRPIVLGLPSVANMLAVTLGFLVIAAATSQPTRRQLAAYCLALLFPIAVASASMVRFALIAMLGATLLAAALATSRTRQLTALAIALTIVAGAGSGLAVRHDTSAKYFRQLSALIDAAAQLVIPAAIAAPADPAPLPTGCGIDTDSSIAIRKLLLAEAIAEIRHAGPFGIGFDGFIRQSCLGIPPHNTLLQATIELGWIGGAALAILVAMIGWRLVPIAHGNPAATFLLCALAFAGALTMAHGRLSRDGNLFLLLGAGASVVASAPRTTPGKAKWKLFSGSWPSRPLF